VSIKYKIIILISLLTFSTVLACGATYYVVSAREHDALLIDIAGAQRMLLQKMGKEAAYIHAAEDFGQTSDVAAAKQKFSVTVARFEKRLNALLKGGLITGDEGKLINIPESKGDARKALLKISQQWSKIKPAAMILADPDSESHSKECLRAFKLISRDTEILTRESDSIVKIFKKVSDNRNSLLSNIQIIALSIAILVALICWHFIRKVVLNPVIKLSSLVKAIGEGDLGRRADIVSADEIGRLGEGINSMASGLALKSMEQEQLNNSLAFALDEAMEQNNCITELNHDLELAKVELEEKKSTLEKEHEELEKTLLELGNTQGQLLQSEKMASIGQLAAGVAHEINNPIGFISSNVGTLGEYLEGLMDLSIKYDNGCKAVCSGNKDMAAFHRELEELKEEIDYDFIVEDAKKVVGETMEGTERLSKIVKDLKEFSHIDKDEKKYYADINHWIESTLNIVWNELKYKAEMKKEYGGIPEVECYPHQLSQVFMNLLVNASQAIEDKGEIGIRTYAKGDRVFIEISDTGKGMPKEVMNRIFEPFYTTKPVGKGTGLGLSVSYGIVEKHSGRMTVESQEGKGTTFTVELPVKVEAD